MAETAEIPPVTPPEQTAGRAQGGRSSANERIIDMVRGSDGRWTARGSEDPNFFYTPPKSETPLQLAPNPQASAGEDPRNAQYQQINQGADEAWANIQQATSGRPLNREAKPNFTASPSEAARQDNRSPRDRWRETENRDHVINREKPKNNKNYGHYKHMVPDWLLLSILLKGSSKLQK